MGTILIDKLLHTVVNAGASDLHIAVGQPPVLRLHGRMRKLETKVLEPEDTVALMKSITPERCQQELQEAGGTDFGFAFGDLARFRVSIFKQRGNVGDGAAADSQQAADARAAWACRDVVDEAGHAAARSVPGHRPDGFGQEHDAGQRWSTIINENVDHHIITIEDPIEFYHNHKKSTVNQREVGVDVPSFRRGDSPRLAAGPRRDPGRRNARPGNDRSGHHRGRNGPRGVRHAAHHQCPGHGQPHHRRLPHQPAGPDPHAALRRRSSASCRQHAAAARSAAAAWRPTRCWSCTPAIANLIRENKTFRITSAIQTGAKLGMQLLDDSLFKLWKDGIVDQGRCPGQGQQRRTTWPRGSPTPSAACSTTRTTPRTRRRRQRRRRSNDERRDAARTQSVGQRLHRQLRRPRSH